MAEVKATIELHSERLKDLSLLNKLLLKTKLDQAVRELRDSGLQIVLSDEKINGLYKSLTATGPEDKYANPEELVEYVFSVMTKHS